MSSYAPLIDAPVDIDGHVTMEVSLARLSAALIDDDGWAPSPAHRTAETFKAEKYDLTLSAIAAGTPLVMPWVFLQFGRLSVMDGRHRLYAMIDRGYSTVTIRVGNRDAEHVSSLLST